MCDSAPLFGNKKKERGVFEYAYVELAKKT
jgi:hypothetical protein